MVTNLLENVSASTNSTEPRPEGSDPVALVGSALNVCGLVAREELQL